MHKAPSAMQIRMCRSRGWIPSCDDEVGLLIPSGSDTNLKVGISVLTERLCKSIKGILREVNTSGGSTETEIPSIIRPTVPQNVRAQFASG